ncbi:MAG: TolC family protein [Candidatus Hydrogenedentes bacterium]|nr:TolC family protein [Candidatus Hydrogenedentota bacterium]
MFKRVIQSLLVVLLLAGFADVSTAEFTVEMAVNLVLDQHPNLRSAAFAVEEEKGEARQAGLLPNPELELRGESWSVARGQNNQMEVLAGITQPLPLSGARKFARQAGEAGVDAATLEAYATRQEIISEAQHLFYETLAAQEKAAIVEEIISLEGQLTELTRQRFEHGDLPEVDYLRASTDYGRYQATLKEICQERDALRRRLAHLCGVSPDEVETCTGSLAPVIEDFPEEASLKDLLSQSPNHLARLAYEDQAEKEVRAEQRSAIPEPGLQVGLRRLTEDRTNRMDVGISVDLPLFDRNQGAIHAAKARVQRIRAENEAKYQEEFRELTDLLLKGKRFLTLAEHLSTEVLPKQETTQQILESALVMGGASLFEVLAEYRSTLETKQEILENYANARDALIELNALL